MQKNRTKKKDSKAEESEAPDQEALFTRINGSTIA